MNAVSGKGISAAPGTVIGEKNSTGFTALRRHWLEMLLLPFAVWALALYQIEGGETLIKVMALAVGGFVVSAVLPLAVRLPFFVLLSAAGVFVVFGWIDGAWLLGVGLTLIGICHLPIPVWSRALIMIAVGIVMAFLRAGYAPVPWAGAVWPILASMFMFRVVLYLKSQGLKHEKNAPTAEQLANVGGAQEDSDCLLAPEWQKLFEGRVAELLKKL